MEFGIVWFFSVPVLSALVQQSFMLLPKNESLGNKPCPSMFCFYLAKKQRLKMT